MQITLIILAHLTTLIDWFNMTGLGFNQCTVYEFVWYCIYSLCAECVVYTIKDYFYNSKLLISLFLWYSAVYIQVSPELQVHNQSCTYSFILYYQCLSRSVWKNLEKGLSMFITTSMRGINIYSYKIKLSRYIYTVYIYTQYILAQFYFVALKQSCTDSLEWKIWFSVWLYLLNWKVV